MANNIILINGNNHEYASLTARNLIDSLAEHNATKTIAVVDLDAYKHPVGQMFGTMTEVNPNFAHWLVKDEKIDDIAKYMQKASTYSNIHTLSLPTINSFRLNKAIEHNLKRIMAMIKYLSDKQDIVFIYTKNKIIQNDYLFQQLAKIVNKYIRIDYPSNNEYTDLMEQMRLVNDFKFPKLILAHLVIENSYSESLAALNDNYMPFDNLFNLAKTCKYELKDSQNDIKTIGIDILPSDLNNKMQNGLDMIDLNDPRLIHPQLKIEQLIKAIDAKLNNSLNFYETEWEKVQNMYKS